MVDKQQYDINELLSYINPAMLSYQEWLNVGMALKDNDCSVSVWDDWSKSDSRYHNGECSKKWNTFCGSNTPITMGTIVQMAKESGWQPDYGHELSGAIRYRIIM